MMIIKYLEIVEDGLEEFLNVKNRISSINQNEMDKAFSQADNGKSALVGVTGHDFRNLATEVEEVQNFIKNSSNKYPDVKFCFSEATSAFKKMIYGNIREEKIDLDIEFSEKKDDVPSIKVKTISGKVFGPQPFLAIKLNQEDLFMTTLILI